MPVPAFCGSPAHSRQPSRIVVAFVVQLAVNKVLRSDLHQSG